jgi:hypothetical protein
MEAIMAKASKPVGFGKFKALTKLLVQVPKSEVEEVEAARPRRKPRGKKKK